MPFDAPREKIGLQSLLPRSNIVSSPRPVSPHPFIPPGGGRTHFTSSAPALRKRHSTNVLQVSPPSDQPSVTPVPNTSAQRPPPSPARDDAGHPGNPTKSKSGARPSTATGARETATPWESYAAPSALPKLRTDSKAVAADNSSTLSSPKSTKTRTSANTGSIEDVTPWDLYPVKMRGGRASIATGPTEDVTPWELHPVPLEEHRSTIATGPIMEVTPWELYPVPDSVEPSDIAMVARKHSHSSSRQPKQSGSSQGKSLSELATVNRRKSNKSSKARSNTVPAPSLQPASSGLSSGTLDGYDKPAHASAPASPQTPLKSGPSLRLFSVSASKEAPKSVQEDPKFSTADRTILEELKRNISVRAAQFTLKGPMTTLGNSGQKGKKHHPYSPKEVPYPRNYEREVLDLDVWETIYCQDVCESLTWHVFDAPPTSVLDLGCGTGTWILNCARTWKHCRFVGLDVVPLHPDLQQVGSSDLASRITWVQANFLDGLPFPNEEFDFVHVKRIALGVPEDKWDFLLDEITRVMRPGGAFEMVEEDLFFPGQPIDSESNSESDAESQNHLSRTSSRDDSILSEHYSERVELSAETTSSLTESSRQSDDTSFPSSTVNTSLLSMQRSPSNSIVHQSILEQKEKEEAQELLSQIYIDYDTVTSRSQVPGSPDGSALLHASVNDPRRQRSNPSSVDAAVPPSQPRTRQRGYSLSSISGSRPSEASLISAGPPNPPFHPHPHPFLLRTIPKPPPNPRDHSLLETIYAEMLGSRFINSSPLALLANSLNLYFEDVRTHPPLQHSFPPPPKTGHPPDGHRSADTSDTDDARDAIMPSPVPRLSKQKKDKRHLSEQSSIETKDISTVEEPRYLDVKNLIHHTSAYITLDESRVTALSPSLQTSFLTSSGSNERPKAAAKGGIRLPNTKMHLDLRSLNLHLALRTAEILACSEAMWEWVLDYQAEARASRISRMARPNRLVVDSSAASRITRASNSSGRRSEESWDDAIVDMTRDDFDQLLSYFEMDMKQRYSLGSALEERFFWCVIPSMPSNECKAFETACEKWDKWEHELEQQRRLSPHPYHRASSKPWSKSHLTVSTSRTLSSTAQSAHTDENTRRHHVVNSARSMEPLVKRDSKSRAESLSSASTMLPPTRRLSRSLRVFCAWKA